METSSNLVIARKLVAYHELGSVSWWFWDPLYLVNMMETVTCLSCNEIVHTVDGGDFGWVYGHRSVGIGDEGVAAIAGGCPRLKVVNVSYCANITDASLRSLAQGLRDLVQLELRACINVTSVGLCYLAASCKHLRELDVKRCSYVSDSGIHAIAQGCPNLRQVQIHCLLQVKLYVYLHLHSPQLH